MKSWPLPNSFYDNLPSEGDRGSYWEDRQIGFNCGVDIFCPPESDVLTIDSGIVLGIGIFSQYSEDHCYENSNYCVIKCGSIIYKYCGISDIQLKLGQKINSGERIGVCERVINKQRINDADPFYLREIAHTDHTTFLHLELFKAPIMEVRPYLFGNYIGDVTPSSLINPVLFLTGLSKTIQI